jgi:putative addiction module CopG family antidote
VNIQLKSEQEQFIRSQIDRGEYQTAEDVISEAFKLLEARTKWKIMIIARSFIIRPFVAN